MFAVIKTGGKQYKVAAGDRLKVEKIAGEVGDKVAFNEVLALGAGDDVQLGHPLLEGVAVHAEIVSQIRGPKVITFKKRRRQNSQRTRGHRQQLSLVEIIQIGGEKPEKKVAKKPVKTKVQPEDQAEKSPKKEVKKTAKKEAE